MTFISGVHGVGKSYFCNKVKEKLGINTFSASKLISEHKHAGFSRDKLIPDIDHNQQYLLMAIRDLNAVGTDSLLDGHFCLLNADGHVTRIPKDTFIALNPDAIVLLTENPKTIAERRRQRDGVNHNTDSIHQFQEEESIYAKEVAETLGIPLKVSAGADDLENTLDFVRETMWRVNDGW